MEIQQCLKTALRDFRLVGRVGGVPRRIFQHIAQDDGGGEIAVIPLADVTLEHFVLIGDAFQVTQHILFGARGTERQRVALEDAWRHNFLHQIIERFRADHLEHLRLLGGIGADVAAMEFAAVMQL